MNLQELIEESGYETRSYSGRGMYGKECLGVCTENVIAFIYDVMETGFDQDRADLEEDIMQIREAKIDQMGKGMIVYFPDVPYKKEDEEEEEEEEEDFKMSNVPICFGYDEYNNVDRVLPNNGPVSSQNYFYISEELYSEYVNIEAQLKYIQGIYENKIEEIESTVNKQRMLFLAEQAAEAAKSEEEKLQDIKRVEHEASQNRILEILSKDNPTRKEKEFVLNNSSEWENIHGGWWAKYGVGFEFAKAWQMCKEDHLEAEKERK